VVVVAAFVLSFVIAGQGAIPMKQPDKVWWIFLERTKTPLVVPKEEADHMQESHIGNFKRLFGLKKLLCAGPLQDAPGGNKRGIVVLTVGSLKAVKDCFLPDPYVQGNILNAHAIPMEVKFGRFELVKADPNGIEENRLVVFTASHPLTREAGDTHWSYVCDTGPNNRLSFAASSTKDDEIVQVALFRGTNDAELQAWLDADPIVKSGVLRATIYPQWLAKGTLPDLSH